MGFWGVRPYENDDAADWFRNLWADLPVPKQVEETLDLDVDSHPDGLVYDQDYSDHLILSDSNSYRFLGKVIW